ncbi:RagB/SusD family nutrient uptake outer membrane protein [Zhouia sp. PK063]|uniref:RagB/SusD family nutrient uptake outer membrane protein n=1 Tax=Zhouia sp. PK063 TaxID=3373602 RepID=UPI0037A354B1
MKKILTFLILGTVLLSCNDDFLDQVPNDRLTFDETFSKKSTVDQYLANIYSRIPNEFAQRYTTVQNSGPWTGASDEAEYVWSFHWGNYLNVGSWDPTTQEVSTLWSNFYRGIRAASTFIQNIDACQDCGVYTKQYTAEARVLRAFFYYNLIRSWGPVILLGDEPVDSNADLSGFERNSMEECVDYIVSELDAAADELKGVSYNGGNAGRMSRPFALALKEKVLLFAASPLYNGNTDLASLKNSEGANLINQTVDVNKWKAAADAGKAFIDEFVPNTFYLYRNENHGGDIDPYLSCRDVMLDDWNEEMIYERPSGQIYLTYDCTPYHSGYDNAVKGAGGLGVTQDFVDAFFTANGRSITDPESGYTDNEDDGFVNFQAPFDDQQRSTYWQWANREPRFYVNVTYNNSLWLNRTSASGDVVTTTWYRGNSGKVAGGNDYTPTGYIARKNITIDHSDNRAIPMLRLAEIYLDYAEALNEYDPGNADILTYLNKIRDRAGVPTYGDGADQIPVPSSQDEMRTAIHKERRVELSLESVRYFDLRRWKEAENVLNGPAHSLNINADENPTNDINSAFYDVVTFENRVFDKKHYLFPIPQDEINATPNLQQNPGW